VTAWVQSVFGAGRGAVLERFRDQAKRGPQDAHIGAGTMFFHAG